MVFYMITFDNRISPNSTYGNMWKHSTKFTKFHQILHMETKMRLSIIPHKKTVNREFHIKSYTKIHSKEEFVT